MKPLEILQGKWLGHPLHPAFVHVPVGLWPVACALDLYVRFGAGSPALAQLALYCVGVGLIATVIAVPTGFAEWAAIKKDKPAWKIALWHMLANVVAAIAWAANFALRLKARDGAEVVPNSVLATAVLGTVFLLVGGYLGKLLVYDHGIGVARLSKQKWRQIAQRGGANVPEESK